MGEGAIIFATDHNQTILLTATGAASNRDIGSRIGGRSARVRCLASLRDS